MTATNPQRDPRAVLCETCGYPIDAIALDRPCPECGRPTETSRPEHRPGSPWQQKPTFHNRLRTGLLTLRHPRATFDQVSIEPRQTTRLLHRNCVLASILSAAAAMIFFIVTTESPEDPNDLFLYVLAGVSFGLVAFGPFLVLYLMLTAIESTGIRFFGTRRGWRINKPVARTVCGHATAGWVISGMLALIGAAAIEPIRSLSGSTRFPSGLGDWVSIVAPTIPIFGIIGGMLVFEVLVYIGMRRCRFANLARTE